MNLMLKSKYALLIAMGILCLVKMVENRPLTFIKQLQDTAVKARSEGRSRTARHVVLAGHLHQNRNYTFLDSLASLSWSAELFEEANDIEEAWENNGDEKSDENGEENGEANEEGNGEENENVERKKRHAVYNRPYLQWNQPIGGNSVAKAVGTNGLENESTARKKRHTISRYPLLPWNHPITIEINGINYTLLGSPSVSFSSSQGILVGNGTQPLAYSQYPFLVHDRRASAKREGRKKRHGILSTLLGNYNAYVTNDTHDSSSSSSEESYNYTATWSPFRDVAPGFRVKRHIPLIPADYAKTGVGYRNTLGDYQMYPGSFSSSMESGEAYLLATVSSTTPASTTENLLTRECCSLNACIRYQKIYDSCLTSGVEEKTCLNSLDEICARYKKV